MCVQCYLIWSFPLEACEFFLKENKLVLFGLFGYPFPYEVIGIIDFACY